jgi:hypothetical protein
MPIASEIVLMKLTPLFYGVDADSCYAGVSDVQLICLKQAVTKRYSPLPHLSGSSGVTLRGVKPESAQASEIRQRA